MTHQSNDQTTHSPVRRRAVLKTAGVTGLALSAGCVGGDDEDDTGDDTETNGADDGTADDDAIVIGSLQPLSGGFAPWGQAHRAGLEFAIDEINANGGVLDRPLEIVETDTESDAGEADTIFRQYVEAEDAVVITGPVSSDVGIRTAQTAEEMEVPMILHMAGSHRIHTRSSRYTFRLGSLPAPMDLQVTAELIEDAGYSSIGAINADYEWGNTVQDLMADRFPDGINLHSEMTAQGETDFTPFLRDMPDDIELLVATGHPPGSPSIHSQAIELGFQHELTTGAGLPPGVLYEALGAEAETFGHLHVADVYSDQYQEVATRFAEERGERMDTHEALGYVTGELIAAAIEDAGSADPVDVADAIREIELDTLLANPLQYNEWGEIDNVVAFLSTFEEGEPDYYEGGEFRLVERQRTEPMSAELVEPLLED